MNYGVCLRRKRKIGFREITAAAVAVYGDTIPELVGAAVEEHLDWLRGDEEVSDA